MKTLEKRVQVIYRFRCDRCRSLFEMTEEEKTENDWKYHEGSVPREESMFPHNPMDYFDCPVCKCRRYVMKRDMHKYTIMDSGREICEY